MFGKSLKYEFRAVSRVVTPILVALLVVSLLMSIGFVIDGRLLSHDEASRYEIPVYAFEAFLGFGFFGLMVALSVTVFVMMFRRFYTSFFTDEGYLTFTLPVSVDCHLMTKIVSMVIWQILSSLAMLLAVLILLGGFELGYDGVISKMFSELFAYEFDAAFAMLETEGFGIPCVIVMLLLMPVSMLMEILLVYFGISLGCMLTKKYRVIVSLVCIMGVNSIMSAVQSFITSLVGTISSSMEVGTVMTITMIITLILHIVWLIVFYLGSKWILTKRLNLD